MIEYSEDWLVSLLFKHKGSVAFRACLYAVPSALVALLVVLSDDPSFSFPGASGSFHGWRDTIGVGDFTASPLWTASTAVLAVLLGFRTNRAMARFWEGTGLLHQMRGEWFDSVSCCVTFSRAAQKDKPQEVKEFRHTIVRLMSLCHGSALDEISGHPMESQGQMVINAVGLNNETLRHLTECKTVHDFNRVEVLLHLIQSLITKNLDDGILKIAPPILSRVYQTLSRGFVNLLNAKKIADTRFPFPYAQTIAILLFVHVVMTPLVMACLVNHVVWAPVFTFIPIFGMFSVNFIGIELENPFGDDENDLPMDEFQYEMNKCLLMLLQDKADLIPGMSQSRGLWDFKSLVESMAEEPDSAEGGGHMRKQQSDCRISDFSQYAADDEEAPRPKGGLLSEKEHSGAPAPVSSSTPAPLPSIAVVPVAAPAAESSSPFDAAAAARMATENLTLHLDARGGQWVRLPEPTQGNAGAFREAFTDAVTHQSTERSGDSRPRGTPPESGGGPTDPVTHQSTNMTSLSIPSPPSKTPDSYVEIQTEEAMANPRWKSPPPVGIDESGKPDLVPSAAQMQAAAPGGGSSARGGTPKKAPLANSMAVSSPHPSPRSLLCGRQASSAKTSPQPDLPPAG